MGIWVKHRAKSQKVFFEVEPSPSFSFFNIFFNLSQQIDERLKQKNELKKIDNTESLKLSITQIRQPFEYFAPWETLSLEKSIIFMIQFYIQRFFHLFFFFENKIVFWFISFSSLSSLSYLSSIQNFLFHF